MSSAHPLQEYYSRIFKTYDLVNRLFTFGMDARWRRHTVEVCLRGNPVSILDLCCGTGDLAISMGRASGKAVHITGFDLNPDMLELARRKASRLRSDRVEFIQGDAGSMPFRDGEFDCITIGFGFRNLTFENPRKDIHCREISRVMKPGARLLILESAVPKNRLVAFFYRTYLKFFLVPLGGLLSGDWNAYRYLSASSAGFYSFEELSNMLLNHRLTLKSGRTYLFGSVNLLIATRI
jgi:demethylmenaquinone methyltransferase / 2-methoxy-6-polyprenyl-1,4-benzoquinol methylase